MRGKHPSDSKTKHTGTQKEYNDEYVEFRGGHIRVSELDNQSVTSKDLSGMTLTTYVRQQLPPKLTDEALLDRTEHYFMQCSNTGYPFVNYEDVLIHTIVPELTNRLKEKNETIEQLKQELNQIKNQSVTPK